MLPFDAVWEALLWLACCALVATAHRSRGGQQRAWATSLLKLAINLTPAPWCAAGVRARRIATGQAWRLLPLAPPCQSTLATWEAFHQLVPHGRRFLPGT